MTTCNYQNLNSLIRDEYDKYRTSFFETFYEDCRDYCENEDGDFRKYEFDGDDFQTALENSLINREFAGSEYMYVNEVVKNEFKKLTGSEMLNLLRYCEETHDEWFGGGWLPGDNKPYSLPARDEEALMDFMYFRFYHLQQNDADLLCDAEQKWEDEKSEYVTDGEDE